MQNCVEFAIGRNGKFYTFTESFMHRLLLSIQSARSGSSSISILIFSSISIKSITDRVLRFGIHLILVSWYVDGTRWKDQVNHNCFPFPILVDWFWVHCTAPAAWMPAFWKDILYVYFHFIPLHTALYTKRTTMIHCVVPSLVRFIVSMAIYFTKSSIRLSTITTHSKGLQLQRIMERHPPMHIHTAQTTVCCCCCCCTVVWRTSSSIMAKMRRKRLIAVQ